MIIGKKYMDKTKIEYWGKNFIEHYKVSLKSSTRLVIIIQQISPC